VAVIDGQTFSVDRVSMALTTGSAQTLARSGGVRPEHLVEVRRIAILPPPPGRTPTMPGALALFKGETIDYILARSEQRPSNPPLVEYLLLPAPMVRLMGGNLRCLGSYLRTPIPVEQRMETPPVLFSEVSPPTHDQQAADLVALMNACKGNLKTVQGMLAGIVQGMGLVIVNAPAVLDTRLTFIQGIFGLLPAPVRVVISFATNVIDPAQTNTQIKFMASPVALDRHLTFDWETGKLAGEIPDDPYTKFIMSQLRLDVSLVIEATDKLARTAVWRSMRRETMSNALAWASKRASLDSAIREGLPAGRDMVASILQEDPTLPDDMRVLYAKHLVTFSLLTNDYEHTEIIPAMAAQNQEVADAIYEQLWAAAGTDKALSVYHLAEMWVAKAPLGVDVTRWRPLLGMAALAHLNTLLRGDAAKLAAYLDTFLDAAPVLQIDTAVAQMIGLCRKRAYENNEIARLLFLLAMTYVPLGGLQRLFSDQALMAQLPVSLRGIMPLLLPAARQREPAQAGVLARASELFGLDYQPVILGRLVEWALTLPRLDLIDENALKGLIRLANSPQARRFDALLGHVVNDLSQLTVIRVMPPGAQCALVQLQLARRQFDAAAQQITFYQDMLYTGSGQETLSKIAREAYKGVDLPPRLMGIALEALQRGGLKAINAAFAEFGALEAGDWSDELTDAAIHLTGILFAEPRLIAALGIEPALRLLQAHSERRDTNDALRTASALTSYMLTFGEGGTALLDRMFPLINWNAEVGEAAMELARTYIRSAPAEQGAQVPRLLARHGSEVGTALDATYRLHQIVGGPDFVGFAERVKMAANLLLDLATFYSDGKELPSLIKLRRNAESVTGGLTNSERARLSECLTRIGGQILRLTALHNSRAVRRNKAENEARRLALIKNRIAPMTAVESLTWMSGYLSEGREVNINLNRDASGMLLGARSVNILLREGELIAALFGGMIAAFSEDNTLESPRAAWAAEIEGLWSGVSLFKQRELRDSFVEDAQRLAQIILYVGERGNERSLQSTGVGKQLFIGKGQPRTVIDALRWLSGYFAGEQG